MRKETGHVTEWLQQKPNCPIVTYGRNTPRLRPVGPNITYDRTGARSCRSPLSLGRPQNPEAGHRNPTLRASVKSGSILVSQAGCHKLRSVVMVRRRRVTSWFASLGGRRVGFRLTGAIVATALLDLACQSIAGAQTPPRTYVSMADIESVLPGAWGLAYQKPLGWFKAKCEAAERLIVVVDQASPSHLIVLTEEDRASRKAPIEYLVSAADSNAMQKNKSNAKAVPARLMLNFEGDAERMDDGRPAGWSIVMPDRNTFHMWRWDKADQASVYKRCPSPDGGAAPNVVPGEPIG